VRPTMASSLEGRPPVEDAAIERVLEEIVRPVGYVPWEYLSRQQLLAQNIARRRRGRPTRVLDIGCGDGALTLTLREAAGFEIAAMDILPERVAAVRARRRARAESSVERLHLVLADAEAGLPFRAHAFDVVVATEVMEHLDRPGSLFQEIRRVLRPGGRFFMTTPNLEALPLRLLKILPRPVVRRFAASLAQEHLHPELLSRRPSHPDEHRREGFTLRELTDLGKQASLRLVEGHAYRIPLPDKLMRRTPKRLARRLARMGTREIPLGLQLYCEFARPEPPGGPAAT